MSTVTINEVKSYWDRRPCNVRHGRAPVGTIEWSQQVTERKYFVEPHIPAFAQFEKWAGNRVLEVGCGIGTDTLNFLRYGASVDAVDVSRKSLALATLRTTLLNDKSLANFYVANAEDWLPAGPYTLAYSFGVLHHTPHPDRVIDRMFTSLKSGGELRIMLYARWSWKNLFTRQQPEAQGGCPLAKKYSGREARKLVEKAGFRVISIRKAHIFQWRVKDYVNHRYVKAFPWRMLPQRLINQVEKYLGWHLLITAVKP